MKAMARTSVGSAFSLAIILFLTACTTTLAPNYDKALVDGLVSTNTMLMEHFAAISSGTEKETFEKREKTYNNLIGNLDALTIQSKARPTPKNEVIETVNKHLEKHGVMILDDGEAPSATALEKISETIVKMRDTDKKQGVTPLEASAFKGQVVIYLDQAMTYESFLER